MTNAVANANGNNNDNDDDNDNDNDDADDDCFRYCKAARGEHIGNDSSGFK